MGARDYPFTIVSGTTTGEIADTQAIYRMLPNNGQPIFNVKGYGATGDGTTDDRPAIVDTFATAPDGSTIFFPRGTYQLGSLVTLTNRSNLHIKAERGAVIRRATSEHGLFLFTGATNIEISGFTFDGAGQTSFSPQIEFTGPTNHVWIHHNRFINTGSPAATGVDRYACCTNAQGTSPAHHDFWFTDNYVEDLQCEFDSIEHWFVMRNVSKNNIDSAAFGSFLINTDNQIVRDGLISDNLIINGDEVAIPLVNDPGSCDGCTMERITVRNNLIYRTALSTQRSIMVGSVNASLVASTNIFRDIHVDDNVIVYEGGVGATATNEIIFFNSSTTSSIIFDNCSISRNYIVSRGVGGGRAIRALRLRHCEVNDNVIVGTYDGILVQGTAGSALNEYNVVQNNVLRNIINVGVYFQNSSGFNIFGNNRFLGTGPTTKYNTSGDAELASDTIQFPPITAFATWDPGSIADGDDLSTTITVTGALVGHPVLASLSTIGANDVLISAHVQATDTVRVVLLNRRGSAYDIGSGTLRVVVFPYQ